MPVVNYHTVNGQMVGQSTGTTFTQYLTDALGSVTATVNGKRVTNTYRYKPYGERLAKTGSGPDPDFQWTGDTGSRVTGRSRAEQYNRARHYGNNQASWTSVDPIWPNEPAYSFTSGNPSTRLDFSGLSDIISRIDRARCSVMNKFVYDYCNACYVKPDQHCKLQCHLFASRYYEQCKRKPRKLPYPGSGIWSPPPGGPGEIAPRPLPNPPSMQIPVPPLPWTDLCCTKIAIDRLRENMRKYGGMQDHLMHCVFYCQVWRSGCPMPALGSEAAEAYLNLCKDPWYRSVAPHCHLIDEIAKRLGLKEKNIISDRDYINNKIGIGCAGGTLSCEECCMANAIPGGGDQREGRIPWL